MVEFAALRWGGMYTPPLLVADALAVPLSRVCEGVVAKEGLRKVWLVPFTFLRDLQHGRIVNRSSLRVNFLQYTVNSVAIVLYCGQWSWVLCHTIHLSQRCPFCFPNCPHWCSQPQRQR
jgi:hypothetical protein